MKLQLILHNSLPIPSSLSTFLLQDFRRVKSDFFQTSLQSLPFADNMSSQQNNVPVPRQNVPGGFTHQSTHYSSRVNDWLAEDTRDMPFNNIASVAAGSAAARPVVYPAGSNNAGTNGSQAPAGNSGARKYVSLVQTPKCFGY